MEAYHDRIREADRGRALRGRREISPSPGGRPRDVGRGRIPNGSRSLERGEGVRPGRGVCGRRGGQAAESLAFDRRRPALPAGLELSPPQRRRPAAALQVNLADCLGNAGRGGEAADVYLAASEGAPTGEALELQRRAADQLLRTGRIEEGLPLLRAVLEKVGLRYPETSLGSILCVPFPPPPDSPAGACNFT